MARQEGVPLAAIPVFLNRRFHHGDIRCAVDSGIRIPSDLEGRRVGVRAYTVSTAVWTRTSPRTRSDSSRRATIRMPEHSRSTHAQHEGAGTVDVLDTHCHIISEDLAGTARCLCSGLGAAPDE
jgi:hypothetical protein